MLYTTYSSLSHNGNTQIPRDDDEGADNDATDNEANKHGYSLLIIPKAALLKLRIMITMIFLHEVTSILFSIPLTKQTVSST